MRFLRVLSIIAALSFLSFSAVAQQVAPRDSQATILLQHSLAALAGTASIGQVTMTGSANWIAGSDNETGTVALKATAIGQARIDLTLSAGSRSEVFDTSTVPYTGSWSGADGTWHPIANHNLWSDPTWFFPAFLLHRVLSSTAYSISAADSETLNGTSVEHVVLSLQYLDSWSVSPLLAQLSRVDVYLNASNLLPVAIIFNTHPDNDARTDIPVRIEFLNYQTVQGALVPLELKRYVNNGLALDLTLDSVQFNTGVTASDFTAN